MVLQTIVNHVFMFRLIFDFVQCCTYSLYRFRHNKHLWSDVWEKITFWLKIAHSVSTNMTGILLHIY